MKIGDQVVVDGAVGNVSAVLDGGWYEVEFPWGHCVTNKPVPNTYGASVPPTNWDIICARMQERRDNTRYRDKE